MTEAQKKKGWVSANVPQYLYRFFIDETHIHFFIDKAAKWGEMTRPRPGTRYGETVTVFSTQLKSETEEEMIDEFEAELKKFIESLTKFKF